MRAPAPRLIAQTLAALEELLRFEAPADRVLSRFFRRHRSLGARDRAFVADTCFLVLRRLRTLEVLAHTRKPRPLLLAALARLVGYDLRELAPLLERGEERFVAAVKADPLAGLPLGVRADLPDWVVESLKAVWDEARILAMGRALAAPAPMDLRVNPLKTTREAVLARLSTEGIEAAPTPYSPLGLRLQGHPAIERHPLFLEGAIEVQDEGSQLLAWLIAPTPHDRVVDFCAGAGGKTLLLGALMRSRGILYAFDVSPARLARMRPRLARSGLSNVHPQRIDTEEDARLKSLTDKIDRVLVDAPCSGLGTARRNPDLKWRQTPKSVAELSAKQRRILAAAAKLVKPGGRLVYATCSILPEENDAIVDDFLTSHRDFRELDCATLTARAHIPLNTGPRLRLSPLDTNTDAFFAAVLERHA